MKKILALVMAAILALSLVACGGSDKVTLKILDTEYAVEDYAICVAKENTQLLDDINAALAELTADGTTKAIVDKYISGVEHNLVFQADAEGKEEIHMATNAQFPPYESLNGTDVVGFDPDMMKAVCDKLGYELKIENMDFDSIIAAVDSGKADVGVAGMTVTEDRLKSIDFTDSYTTATQVIIVRK